MSYLDKFLKLAGDKRVRTQAGSEKYDAPIGTPIEASPDKQIIRAGGVRPGQQIKTAAGFQTVGVTREDRVRKGVIHVFGTNGKLLLTIQSNRPVDIKVRIPDSTEDSLELSQVATEAGAKKYSVPVGSTVSATQTPLKSANKAISKAVTPTPNMVKHGRPTFTRKGWHEELSNHVKRAYPGVTLSLRKTPAGHVAVDQIKVDDKSRGQGLANKAMKDLIDVADHMGSTLALSPPDGEGSGDLTKWYEAWGFEKHDDPNIREGHRRVPKGKTIEEQQS